MRNANIRSRTPAAKVMIVEDEAIIARDIQMQLTNFGFTVTGTAQSGNEALEQMEHARPDIVLMDIRLKGEMDGVQAAEIVRSRYSVPVIYLTAHADEATLERAQITEPFGYIVKPLGNTNIKATVLMALYKHRMERELENRRAFLSTILQGLPDALLIADVAGEVLLLNRAAEQLTGWSDSEAVGKSLPEICPIENREGRVISEEVLQQAVAQGAPVRIPRDCALIKKSGEGVEISGHVGFVAAGNRAAGVLITLQDATVQKGEDQRLRQEQQMFVAGELAHGVAREFYGLFDLIEDTADNFLEHGNTCDVELIRKASQIGIGMSTQLLELREGHGSAHVVNVNQYLLASRPVLEGLCGNGMQLEISSTANVGYVLSTGNHFEQILPDLLLEAKRRLDGQGRLLVRADVHTQQISPWRTGSYVRLLVRAEPSSTAQLSGTAAPLRPDTEASELRLALVRAIAIASEGFTRFTEPEKSTTIFEVFLPRHDARFDAGEVVHEYPRVVLLIGLQHRFVESLRTALGETVLLLEAASLDEAALIAELYPGDIDVLVVNTSRFLPKTKNRSCDRIRARRPQTFFLEVSSPDGPWEEGPLSPSELERRVRDMLNRKSLYAIASVE